jgi:hypothetical protein
MFLISLGLLVLAYNTFSECWVFALVCVIGAVIVACTGAV